MLCPAGLLGGQGALPQGSLRPWGAIAIVVLPLGPWGLLWAEAPKHADGDFGMWLVRRPGHVGQAKSIPVGRGGSLPAEARFLPSVPQSLTSALPNISLPLKKQQESISLRTVLVRCHWVETNFIAVSSVMAHLSRQKFQHILRVACAASVNILNVFSSFDVCIQIVLVLMRI